MMIQGREEDKETALVDGMTTLPVSDDITKTTTSIVESTIMSLERQKHSPVAEQPHLMDDVTEQTTVELRQLNEGIVSPSPVHSNSASLLNQNQQEDGADSIQQQQQQQQQLASSSSQDPTMNVKKRRGPKPRPRDEFGNIIKTASPPVMMTTTRRHSGADTLHMKTTTELEMLTNSSMKSPKMFVVGEKDHDGTDNETTSQRGGDEGRDSETEGDIRCICDFTDDDGFTIQCEQCLVWQHMDCVGVDDENVPEDYFCEKCRPRPVNSEAANRLQRKKRLKQVRRKSSSFHKGTNGSLGLHGGDPRETDLNSKMSQAIENPIVGYDEEEGEERSRHSRHHDIHVDSNSEESSSELMSVSRKTNELRSLKRRGRPPSISATSIAHMDLAHEASRKLSREERKLQQLMETFNRLEDREKKKAKRHHEGDSSRSSLLPGEDYNSNSMRFLHDGQDHHSSDESLSEEGTPVIPAALHKGRRSLGHAHQHSTINRDSYGGGSGGVTPNARRRSNASLSRRNRLSHMSLYALKGKKAWLLHSSHKPSSMISPLISHKRMIIVKLEAKDATPQLHKEEIHRDFSTRKFDGNHPEFLDSTTNIDVVGIGSPTEQQPQIDPFSAKIPHSSQESTEVFLKQETSNLLETISNSMSDANPECVDMADSHVVLQGSVDGDYSQQTDMSNRDDVPFSSENHELNLPSLDENRMGVLPITKKVSLSDYRRKKQTTGSLDTEMTSLAQT